jgi:hypothetical protein
MCFKGTPAGAAGVLRLSMFPPSGALCALVLLSALLSAGFLTPMTAFTSDRQIERSCDS